MKTLAFIRQPGHRLAIAALLIFCSVMREPSGVLAAIDSNLIVTVTRTNQNIVLRWFGSNGVPYQVQSSSTLSAWANASLIITGSGAFLFATNPIASQSRGFFRIMRVIPDDPWTAVFNFGILTIGGNDRDNSIVVSRTAGGSILVNGGAVPITGGTPTIANTTLIQIFGHGGDDYLALDEANGALPKAILFGEEGNDTLTGGSGDDVLNGGPGSDILLGKGGADNLLGGDNDDIITGGDGNDTAQMGDGNDRFVWNPGDDTDVIDGTNGVDTVEINGGNGAEAFTTTANGTRVRFDRINPAPFSLDIGTCENLVLNANGGDDNFSASNGLAALIQITVDGGAGLDTLLGGDGADVLTGGDGADIIDGNRGNDLLFGGAADDVFQWDPGDGSDTIEGQAGNDTLIFNGANIGEHLDLSANGSRLRLFRDVANVTLDCDDVETVQLQALGGADVITVNNLSATDVKNAYLNLSGTLGGSTGDGQADNVIVNATGGNDVITIAGNATSAVLSGLSATVTLTSTEAASDRLTLNTLAGDDVLDASGLPAGAIALTADGGDNDDVLTGSGGDDILLGGAGDDVLIGGPGVDALDGGTGNNIVIQ